MTAERKLIVPAVQARRGSATSSGLLLPMRAGAAPVTGRGKDHPALKYVHAYLTWEEMSGQALGEPDIVERLARMSAYDVLQALSRLSCMVHASGLLDLDQQILIMRRIGWPAEILDDVRRALEVSGDGRRVLFFPQQIVHLARLAVLHCDSRPSDDFGDGEHRRAFLECLFGVTDLLEDTDLDAEDVPSTVSWMLRQSAINRRQESVLLWARYYDIFIRTWGDVATPEAFDAAEAFQRFTGMELPDWLTVGFAVYIRFLQYGNGSTEEFFLDPERWFSEGALDEVVWGAFLAANIQTLDECRTAIQDEEARYGPTQYRCQTFERRPLLAFSDGRVITLALDSLERRATEGIFFELADGAQAEGQPREHFTSPFGLVFEEFVQRALERALPAVGVPRVYRPHRYVRGGDEVESSDAVVDSGDTVIFGEVVAKRPVVATLTRGDYSAFKKDLADTVLKKARQLHLNIAAYRAGELRFDQLAYDEGQRIWPVLFIVEGFPTMPPIQSVIAQAIADEGWLQGLPPLAIIDAEELAALEGLLAAGFSFAELLQMWKGDEGLAVLPFANLVDTLDDDRLRAARRAEFYEAAWEELTNRIITRVFPRSPNA